MRVYRLEPKTGLKRQPIRDAAGNYVLGDPRLGKKRHTVANQVLVKTEQEMIDLILIGHYVRVETDTRPSLVRLNLFVDGKQIS